MRRLVLIALLVAAICPNLRGDLDGRPAAGLSPREVAYGFAVNLDLPDLIRLSEELTQEIGRRIPNPEEWAGQHFAL